MYLPVPSTQHRETPRRRCRVRTIRMYRGVTWTVAFLEILYNTFNPPSTFLQVGYQAPDLVVTEIAGDHFVLMYQDVVDVRLLQSWMRRRCVLRDKAVCGYRGRGLETPCCGIKRYRSQTSVLVAILSTMSIHLKGVVGMGSLTCAMRSAPWSAKTAI